MAARKPRPAPDALAPIGRSRGARYTLNGKTHAGAWRPASIGTVLQSLCDPEMTLISHGDGHPRAVSCDRCLITWGAQPPTTERTPT